ncbi:MAG TPA: S26 family signal peptidase [Oligoflexus sp.]|uniref:S26 family signal peptidase n=1 Tax=Oligoflexus sp. TaxID=1971216 RepID=UPI002D6BFA41|nr:S26 family signal peptidase [Oligoflexus sp.]HYX34618.1 S26 family signal peptidase [Oligoflexus sp.]
MPADHDNIQNERTHAERLRLSLVRLIVLDLITLGLYSVVRSYGLHAELSQKEGRPIFSIAFLNILMMLNIMLWVLRFSRNDLPLDASLVMAHLGTTLLFMSLMLVFRRHLEERLGLGTRPLPLALFGFWYLQHRINHLRDERKPGSSKESWLVPSWVLGLSLLLSLMNCGIRLYHVTDATMEPVLVRGDYVLVDQLLYELFEPQPDDLVMVHVEPSDQPLQLKRWDKPADSRAADVISAGRVVGRARMRTISYQPGESIPWERWFQLL